jgi:ribonuclease J
MAVSITCYGGVGCIGGNKILLEDRERKTRVFLDFGIPFSLCSQFFAEFMGERPAAGLRDPLRLKLLPPLVGAYRSDLVSSLSPEDRGLLQDNPQCKDVQPDGVFLSHAHLDHSGYISYLREDIPIYTSSMSAFITKAIQDTGGASNVCYFSERELVDGAVRQSQRGNKELDGRPFVLVDQPKLTDHEFWHRSPAVTKTLNVASTSSLYPDRIGKLPLLHFPVDHSIFGANACALETSAGWIVYTGDFRMHGGRGNTTEEFIEAAASLQPVALIVEGTHVGDVEEGPTEADVYDAALRAVRGAKGQVIADFGSRHIERLLTFLRIAKETDRQLAITAKDAYLLEAMGIAWPDLESALGDPGLIVYRTLKASPGKWELEIYDRYGSEGRLIDAWEAGRHPGDYILCFSLWDLSNLIDIDPQEGTYIYSSSEVYDEAAHLDMEKIRHWLGFFGLDFIGDPENPESGRGLHASGHASGPQLMDMIKRIQPQKVIPVHTEQPEAFAEGLENTSVEVDVPILGESIRL